MTDEPGSIRFLPDGVDVPGVPGESLLSHALRGGVPILSPCGGENRCGKCRVRVDGETRGGEDPGVLSRGEIASGIRLACRCFPSPGNVSVTILPESRPARLVAYLDGKDLAGDEPFLPLSRAASGGSPLGVALDLGTSTLAGTLVDLSDGTVLSRATADNPQMACGEDLISRVVFAEETTGGFELLRGRLLSGVDGLMRRLIASSRAAGEITDVVAAGNTVISHFLYGISPSPIRRPPYHPVRKEYPAVPGETLGTGPETARASWRIFPSLGGFVGGDVVAGILASGMHRKEEVSLLFDVGTNGEVVLGNRDWLIACSSSAGPAFEGGEVGCGMRAYPGAIESVRIEPETAAAEWTAIGRVRPAGLCGSGILDLCAELFRTGIVDRAGRFTSRGGGGRRSTERGEAFVVVPAEKSATSRDVAFCEVDLKSVLRTKAALCAAAEALLAAVGIPRENVARVYVAGGFGNFIDLRSALTIGLFPPIPLARFAP
ncbi:MAG TPA: ASKHA domain-containing protein, partial [Candidatus Deferrimicrobiaceae bacterium]|nr:ASKHA domain-containing protein [Candidatus Deferrimicrobiaceae bacterium]